MTAAGTAVVLAVVTLACSFGVFVFVVVLLPEVDFALAIFGYSF
jgi:hypothetical protein